MTFSGRPCRRCKKGMINPSKYQTICSKCKAKNHKKKMKKLRIKWEKNKRKRLNGKKIIS